MGWLAATPKPDPRSRRAKKQSGPPPVSRVEANRRRGVTPLMPPNPAPIITDRWIRMGMVERGGMSQAPLSWREIEAWQSATGIDLPSWQAELIRRLSTEYLAELHAAEDESRPAPWHAPVTRAEVTGEVAGLLALIAPAD